MKSKAYLPPLVPTSQRVKQKIELDFVLPGLLSASVGGVISPGGVGKSFWLIQVGLQVANAWSRDLIGEPVKQGDVVIFSAEDAADVTTMRIQSMIEQGCATTANLDRLKIYSLAGSWLDLMADSCLEELTKAGAGARLIVLDTLKRFHTLDENSTQDMSRLMARMEKLAAGTGAAVLFVHHTTKSAVLNGQQGLAQAARGASVLVDNCRWLAFLATMSEQEARTYGVPPTWREKYVRWNIAKQNYGKSQEDRWYERKVDGVLHPVELTKAPVRFEMVPPTPEVQNAVGPNIRQVPHEVHQVGVGLPDAPTASPSGGVTDWSKPIQFGAQEEGLAGGVTPQLAARQNGIPSARNVNGGNW